MYDFTTRVERRNSTSIKWKLIEDDMGEGNDDVIAMSVADMEFKPAPQIVRAIVDAAQHDVFGYDYATDEYFAALAGWMARRHHMEVRPEWVTLSDGVMPAVNTALRAFTHPGDAIVIQRPVYYPFTSAAQHNGLTILNNALAYDEATHTYTIDFGDLEAKLADPRCTTMLLCNPHNPVGCVWTAGELRRIATLCRTYGVLLLIDEIHADFSWPEHPVTMMGELGDDIARQCIEFTAPTKTFNLAGLLCSNTIIRDPELKTRFDVAAENIGGMTVSHFGLVACIAASGWCFLPMLFHAHGVGTAVRVTAVAAVATVAVFLGMMSCMWLRDARPLYDARSPWIGMGLLPVMLTGGAVGIAVLVMLLV